MNHNIVYEYRVQILEHHLDTFGHVNNAVYLELYEEARWDFITRNGWGLDKIQESKIGPVILEVNVRYRRELKNREWITIRSQSEEIKGKLMMLRQEIIKEDGKSASDALYTVGLMDLKERSLIPPTHDWLQAIGVKSL
jgi:YbgC/YbaW family acyl-CoA thioester hydrolase